MLRPRSVLGWMSQNSMLKRAAAATVGLALLGGCAHAPRADLAPRAAATVVLPTHDELLRARAEAARAPSRAAADAEAAEAAAALAARAPLQRRYDYARARLCPPLTLSPAEHRALGDGYDRCYDYALTVALANPGHPLVGTALGHREDVNTVSDRAISRGRVFTEPFAGDPGELLGAPVPATPVPAAPAPRRYAAREARPLTYTVQPGDTLSLIARRTYGDASLYTAIHSANRDSVPNPNRIYPGQVLTLPAVATG